MSEDEYEFWFDKDLKRDDFLEAESEDIVCKICGCVLIDKATYIDFKYN